MSHIDIVFDGPPGHESGRFVDVEDEHGHSISAGNWIKRPDGYWALRIPHLEPLFPHGLLSPWRIETQLGDMLEKLMPLMDDIKTALAQDETDEAQLIAVLKTTLASNQALANQLSAALAVGDQTALLAIKNQLDADNIAMQAAINMTSGTVSSTGSLGGTGSLGSSGTVANGGTIVSSGTVDSGATVVSTSTVDSGGSVTSTGTVDSGGTVDNTGTMTSSNTTDFGSASSSSGSIENDGSVSTGGTVDNTGTV